MRRQTINPGRQDHLHRGRHLNARQGFGEAVRPALTVQRLCLHECTDTLFKEEGVSFGPLEEQLLHHLQLGGLPQEFFEQLLGSLGQQGVKPQLSIVGLTPPPVLVLRAIADDE